MSPRTQLPRDARRIESESGSILILTALAMVCLLGVVALAVDGSFMYTERNRMSAAADAAAKSDAWEIFRLSSVSQGGLEAHADHEVAALNFSPARQGGDTVVNVYHPPITGAWVGNNDYVEVTVERPTPTFFGRILGWVSLTPKARAVAGQSNGQSCVQTMAPPGNSTPSVSLGNTTLQMPACTVEAGGDIQGTNPNADINAGGISASGQSCYPAPNGNLYCSNMESVSWSAPAPYDQFAGQVPDVPSPLTGCTAAPATPTIGGGGACYTGLTIPTGGTVTLAAGTTYFTGPITYLNNGTLQGTDATIVLADGASFTTGNNSTLTLSAPTSGGYNGIAIYQPASNRNPINFQNSPLFNVNGAVYAPTADVYFRNGLRSTSDCILMVVWTLFIDNGNGYFNNACTRYSGSPLMTVSLAE